MGTAAVLLLIIEPLANTQTYASTKVCTIQKTLLNRYVEDINLRGEVVTMLKNYHNSKKYTVQQRPLAPRYGRSLKYNIHRGVESFSHIKYKESAKRKHPLKK